MKDNQNCGDTEMTVGSGGEEYEREVLRVIKPEISKIKGFSIKEGTSTAAFAANVPDLQLQMLNKVVNVEIKQDSKAQMGGGSFNYDMKTGKFSLSAKTVIDKAIKEKLEEVLDSKKSDLNKLLNYASKNDVAALGSEVSGLPLRASKAMWEELTKNNFLVPLNSKIETPIDFLHQHYKKKNCYYIQIGKAGLYYLDSNPLQLPVPQLKLNFTIELRLGRSGSTPSKTLGIDVASGNIRAQGRLGGRVAPSPYSLDKPNGFTKTFGSVSPKLLEKME
jgi:hypothetical protein